MGARGLYRGEWGMGMALVVSEDWMELCDWLSYLARKCAFGSSQAIYPAQRTHK